MSPQRRELLRLVQEVPEERLFELTENVRRFIPREEGVPPELEEFIGMVEAEPEFASNAKEILRTEIHP
mgnify:FL=1